MPPEPFRFLHAAGLDPERPVHRPAGAAAGLFERAAARSLERLVSLAIELRVDFLVATADPPEIRDDEHAPPGPSLRAANELTRQFRRLHEANVAVVLAAAGRGWDRLGALPGVVVLTPQRTQQTVTRDGRALAAVHLLNDAPADLFPPSASGTHAGPFAVGLAPRLGIDDLDPQRPPSGFDYLAVGHGTRRVAAHGHATLVAPGAIQAAGPRHPGPHGATLVKVEPGGPPVTAFHPTAAARFETLHVTAGPNDGLEDAALRIAERLESVRPEAGETVWAIRWLVEAAEPLHDALLWPAARADLRSLLSDRLGDGHPGHGGQRQGRGVPVTHEVRVTPHAAAAVSADSGPADPFAAEFAAAPAQVEPLLAATGGRMQLLGLTDDVPHRRRLAALLAAADAAAVMGQGRRYGLQVAAATRDAG